MKIIIHKPKFSELLVGLAYLALGMLGVAIIYFTPNIFALVPPCLFKSVVGIPCPACGATHSGFYLSHLQPGKAFLANPFFFLFFIFIGLWGLNALSGLLLRKNVKLVLSEKEQKKTRLFFILAFPINWAYLIVAHLLR